MAKSSASLAKLGVVKGNTMKLLPTATTSRASILPFPGSNCSLTLSLSNLSESESLIDCTAADNHDNCR